MLNGSGGNDLFSFPGQPQGYVQIDETWNPVADTSQDSLDFSGLTTQGITLDIASTSKQAVAAGLWLRFDASSVMGIENITGTQASDTILGNDRSNILYGASFASNPSRTPVARNQRTQWVLVDFSSATGPDEYVYTAQDRQAVIRGMQTVYYGYDDAGQPRLPTDPNRWFDVKFTEKVADIPIGTSYATIRFNETPSTGNPGGESSEVDFGNGSLGGTAVVQVHGLLGGTALAPRTSVTQSAINGDFLEDMPEDGEQTFGQRNPDNTVDNFLALSIKIAAHELGHLLGLRHYDAFGPVGTGIHSPPGSAAFKPEYTGPSEAFETFNHLISSPASVGSDRKNDIGSLFFGEREALKLAFATSDPSLVRALETAGSHQLLTAPQALAWSTIQVPNTLGRGINVNKSFFVETLNVSGAIKLDATTGKSESDFYSFSGKRGDLVTIEVLSQALRRFVYSGSQSTFNVDGYIDSVVRLYNSAGQLVQYYDSQAVNDDEFESSDSLLVDLVLPATDTYRIEVDTFTRAALPTDPTNLAGDGLKIYNDFTRDTDVGSYELFIYRFARANARDGIDVIRGRGGVDLIFGGDEDDYSLYLQPGTIPVNAQGLEAVEYSATVGFVDPTGSDWTATVNYGDGTLETVSEFDLQSGLPISHLYDDNGTYTIQFTITNDDGRSVSGLYNVLIGNAVPTSQSQVIGNQEVQNIQFTAVGHDSAGDLTAGLHYIATLSQSERNASSYGTSQSNPVSTFQFADNGIFTIYSRVMDKDGGFTDYSTPVEILNQAPTARIVNSGPITENRSALISILDAADVSPIDSQAGLRYFISRDAAARAAATYATASTNNSNNLLFVDNGSYTVYGRVLDKDGGASDVETVVNVVNVDPTVSITGISSPRVLNMPITVSTSGADQAGNADPLTYHFEVYRNGVATPVASQSSPSSNMSFVPDAQGNYSIAVYTTDDDGGRSSTATSNFVVSASLQ